MPGANTMLISLLDMMDAKPDTLTHHFVHDKAILAMHFWLDSVMKTLDLGAALVPPFVIIFFLLFNPIIPQPC